MKNETVLRNLLVFGILILLSLLSVRFHFKLDLTKNGLFTLSPYTHDCIGQLESEVDITWYRSSSLTQYTPAVRYIEDFLDQYAEASGRLISFKIIDPELQRQTEKIILLGIISRQTEMQQKEGSVSKDLYSGLLVEYRGQHRVIPFLFDTLTLEYDLTRLLAELQNASTTDSTKNRIQILFGRTPATDEYQYIQSWITYAGFTSEQLELPVLALDIRKVLLVIGSTELDSTTADTIKTFIDAGGNAAFFVSGNTVDTYGNWMARPKTNDKLIELLSLSGISIEVPLLLDISNYRITMPALDNKENKYINYPFWIISPRTAMANNHPLLSGVQKLQFYWPSYISIPSVLEDEIQGLVSSSPSSIIMEEPYDTDPFGNQLSLFSSNRKAASRYLVASKNTPGRLLVIADEYLISSLIEYTDSDSNLDFLVNCIEWISGKDSLLFLKNKR